MMNHFCKRVLLSFAAMLFVVSATAQVTTSTLNGKVSDAQGEPVVGATVVAVHTPSGSQYYAVANAEGRYFINGMRAGGPYTVEVSCLGYTTVTYTDITLTLAEDYALNATLADDAEMLGEVVSASTKANLEARVAAENGACAGKTAFAKKCKEMGLDALHDSIHEMARDEARHGQGFKGLLDRYFK